MQESTPDGGCWTLPGFCAEKRGAGPTRGQDCRSCPKDRPFGFNAALVKEGQKQPPQTLHRGYSMYRDGDCRKEDMPEDAERKRSGDTGHPCRYFGKLVSAGFLERKKQENRSASSFPRCSLLDRVLPEQAAIAASDCRVGVPPGRDRARAAAPEEFLDGISTMLKDLVETLSGSSREPE